MVSTRERLLPSATVPGLGWGNRGCNWGPRVHLTQPADLPVSVYLHNLGVLPHVGQALYHAPLNAAYTRHPPAASAERQVSQ